MNYLYLSKYPWSIYVLVLYSFDKVKRANSLTHTRTLTLASARTHASVADTLEVYEFSWNANSYRFRVRVCVDGRVGEWARARTRSICAMMPVENFIRLITFQRDSL